MRAVHWKDVRVQLKNSTGASHAQLPFDSQMPWNAVLCWTAFGTGEVNFWWNKYTSRSAKFSDTTDQCANAAINSAMPSENSSGAPQPKDTNVASQGPDNQTVGSKRRARDARRLEARAAAVSSGRRADKRFLSSESGQELCYAWNRSESECTSHGPCSLNPPRAHLCEWCLGEHKAIDNTCGAANRPQNWKPVIQGVKSVPQKRKSW